MLGSAFKEPPGGHSRVEVNSVIAWTLISLERFFLAAASQLQVVPRGGLQECGRTRPRSQIFGNLVVAVAAHT